MMILHVHQLSAECMLSGKFSSAALETAMPIRQKGHGALCAFPAYGQMFQGTVLVLSACQMWGNTEHQVTLHEMTFSYFALSQLLVSSNATLVTA